MLYYIWSNDGLSRHPYNYHLGDRFVTSYHLFMISTGSGFGFISANYVVDVGGSEVHRKLFLWNMF